MTAGLQYDCNTQRFSAEAEGGIYLNILTEEELNKIENSYGVYLPGLAERYPDVVNLISSNRTLLSANAELSFKNQKYKEILDKLDAHMDFSDQMRSNEVMVFEDVSGINQTFKEAYRLVNPAQSALNEAMEEHNYE